MKFLVDAQLPRRLALWLEGAGHDAVHTLDLPQGNRTPDEQVNELAASEGYVVVTKDADFVNSHLLLKRPPKLLLVSTGNIGNAELMSLFTTGIGQVCAGFETYDFIEMSSLSVIFHS